MLPPAATLLLALAVLLGVGAPSIAYLPYAVAVILTLLAARNL